MGENNYVIVGIGMTIIFFIMGLIFAVMKEKASSLIAGYNFKSKEERKKYDEKKMSMDMRNFFFICSGIFVIGTVATYIWGANCFWISFIIFIVYFFRDVHIDDEKAFGKYKK